MMKSLYENLEKQAKKKEDENWKFRSFLKYHDDLPVDKIVFEIADEVASRIDCTTCGRCCAKLKPRCSAQDQQRLAVALSITAEQLRGQYLEYDQSDDEPGWRMKNYPCPFLKDKKCTVYEDRPDNCRDYPYLHEPEFTSRTWGMIEWTFICPIVFQVMEELKKELGG